MFIVYRVCFILILFGFLFLAGCVQSGDLVAATNLPAPTLTVATEPPEAQPTTPGESDYYYYVDGVRVSLTPSFDWVSVKFVSDDPLLQADVLNNFGNLLMPLDQALNIPLPPVTLLRLREGIAPQEFADLLDVMRQDKNGFLQAAPVFYAEDVDLVMTDEFIAAFPAGISQLEIDEVNSRQGVELVKPVLGQENTFVLRVTDVRTRDALSMANWYQESGLVLHAAPNFLRIKTK